MALPKLSDFITFKGKKLTTTDWDSNVQTIINILANGTFDLKVSKLTAASYVGINPDDVVISAPRGYKDGLTLSNSAGDLLNDIEIAVGVARDTTNTQDINLTSSLIKQIDAVFAVGTNVGGFPSTLTGGVVQANTWYYVFGLSKDTDDIEQGEGGFDETLTPTKLLLDAAGFTKFRRIGSVLTNGSSEIIAFNQIDDEIWWDSQVTDDTRSTTSTSTITLTTPPLIKTKAFLSCELTGSSGAHGDYFIRDLALSSEILITGHTETTSTTSSAGNTEIWTNLASQIQVRLDEKSGPLTGVLETKGWRDLF